MNLDSFDDSDNEDDDKDSALGSSSVSAHGSVVVRPGHHSFLPICRFVPQSLSVQSSEVEHNALLTVQPMCGLPPTFVDSHALLAATIRRELRLLKLAAERLGGWSKQANNYERLTTEIWTLYAGDLQMKEGDVLTKKWKLDAFGAGKAEGDISEDGFVVPQSWEID